MKSLIFGLMGFYIGRAYCSNQSITDSMCTMPYFPLPGTAPLLGAAVGVFIGLRMK